MDLAGDKAALFLSGKEMTKITELGVFLIENLKFVKFNEEQGSIQLKSDTITTKLEEMCANKVATVHYNSSGNSNNAVILIIEKW